MFADFYRAARMHSGLRCSVEDVRPSIGLSVCLSHASILSTWLNISSNFFSPSGSHTILVFPHQTVWQYCNGDCPNGGIECKGYENIAILDQYLVITQKRYKIRL